MGVKVSGIQASEDIHRTHMVSVPVTETVVEAVTPIIIVLVVVLAAVVACSRQSQTVLTKEPASERMLLQADAFAF